MGDLESVSGFLDFNSEMSSFVLADVGHNEFRVNYSLQPAVKDVDFDAQWFAWCRHPANLPPT